MHAVEDISDLDDVDTHVDGRSLRRERNREAVIEAFLALVREGNYDPGGAEIAERAGVSHRSVFRYFDDLADLMVTAVIREVQRVMPLATLDRVGEGTFDDRLERLVDAKMATFANLHGIATVTRLRAVTIPTLTDLFADITAGFRSVMEAHFAPELARFPEADRTGIADGAQVLFSWDAYDLHLRLYGHDLDRIRRSTIVSARALFNP